MHKKENNQKRIIFIIAIIVISILIGIFIGTKLAKKDNIKESNNNGNENVSTNNELNLIHLNEDLHGDGEIENLENVRWNNANIMQFDNTMEISINLSNMQETEKVEARTLTINLLDKSGKVVVSKDVEMQEIPADYGYTTLDLEFDIEEVFIVYDIQIIAK